MKLFVTTTEISFLIIILSIFGCKTKLIENQNDIKHNNQINSLMTKYYEQDLFNGNILVVKNNTIIYQKSFGYINDKQQIKLNKNAIFNIGSIAKEFNGVAIMMLQERGLLNINDTISQFDLGLPDWSKKVTIKHLLNYTSGILRINTTVPRSDKEAWKILRNSDSLLFEPGTSFFYDNSNVFLQKRIIEKVTGQSFEEFIIENIVQPLKMTSAVFDPLVDYPNRTSCYDFNKVKCPEMAFLSSWLWVDINDLYKWIHAMNSNTLISQESFDILLRNPYVKNKTSSIGEYFEKEKLQRHNGTSYKFKSIYLNDLKNDVTIILLSNYSNVRDNLFGLVHSIHDLMLNRPYKSVYKAIKKECLEDIDSGIDAYYVLKENHLDEYRFSNPNELNKLGYELLSMGKKQDAIKIFLLATSEFPDNANSFDSLGEAYYSNKEYELALDSYNKAIDLGGTDGNAKTMVDKINKILKEGEML